MKVLLNTKRVALVTGATGSLGRTIVRRFSESEAFSHIYATFKSNAAMASELAKLPAVHVCECDLNTADLQGLPEKVDVLVNNAALAASKATTDEVTFAECSTLMSLNAYAPLRLVGRFLPGMVRSGWGRIINVGSIWSLRGSENNVAYTMSKHALVGLTKTIAVEYGKMGITCNDVCPGPMDSEMINRIFESRSAQSGRSAEELKREFVSSLRTGRMVTTGEVAAVVQFLASDCASGVNGTSLTVDAGLIV